MLGPSSANICYSNHKYIDRCKHTHFHTHTHTYLFAILLIFINAAFTIGRRYSMPLRPYCGFQQVTPQQPSQSPFCAGCWASGRAPGGPTPIPGRVQGGIKRACGRKRYAIHIKSLCIYTNVCTCTCTFFVYDRPSCVCAESLPRTSCRRCRKHLAEAQVPRQHQRARRSTG